jgi:hypothetical protein
MLQCNLKFHEDLDEAKFDQLITQLRGEANSAEPVVVEKIMAYAKQA